jgi:hypothetical protein
VRKRQERTTFFVVAPLCDTTKTRNGPSNDEEPTGHLWMCCELAQQLFRMGVTQSKSVPLPAPY